MIRYGVSRKEKHAVILRTPLFFFVSDFSFFLVPVFGFGRAIVFPQQQQQHQQEAAAMVRQFWRPTPHCFKR